MLLLSLQIFQFMSIRSYLSALFSIVALSLFGQNNAFVLGHSGPNGLSTLYSININTGAYVTIGPVGFERCGSLEIDQTSGIAYSACERADGSNTPVLIRINLSNGAGTEIGPTGAGGAVTDLAFAPSGTLYLYDGNNDPSHSLYTVNTASGAASLVQDLNLAFSGGNGIVFIGNTLYHNNADSCNIIDISTGQATTTGALTGFDIENARSSAMDINPLNNQVYSLIKIGFEGGTNSGLIVLDPTNCTITDTISTILPLSFDGIAFPGQAIIPSMGQWGLIILALLIFIGSVVMFKERTGARSV